jgi:hypothetical protein
MTELEEKTIVAYLLKKKKMRSTSYNGIFGYDCFVVP